MEAPEAAEEPKEEHRLKSESPSPSALGKDLKKVPFLFFLRSTYTNSVKNKVMSNDDLWMQAGG